MLLVWVACTRVRGRYIRFAAKLQLGGGRLWRVAMSWFSSSKEEDTAKVPPLKGLPGIKRTGKLPVGEGSWAAKEKPPWNDTPYRVRPPQVRAPHNATPPPPARGVAARGRVWAVGGRSAV